MLVVLLRPVILIGLLAHAGHFGLFTYIHPFLESSTGVDTDGLALMLLSFGVANFAGTLLAGWLMQRSLRMTLALMPALVGIAALSLVLLPASLAAQALLVAFWGLGSVACRAGGMVELGGTLRARSGRERGRHGGGLSAILHCS